TRAPWLARRLDGISGMELTGGALLLRAPGRSWAYGELEGHRRPLEEAARGFFGPGTRLLVEPSPAEEVLPFPVLSTKTWNHVAFWAWSGGVSVVLALPKPAYLEALRASDPTNAARSHAEARVLRHEAPAGRSGADAAAWVLPDVLDGLCALAREKASYAQLVTGFPGDTEADLLESRLYAVKEWGTPTTPGPVLQKYVGRAHYASAGLAGLRAVVAAVGSR
ncbi:MAG: hypothetical protein HY900_17480, partial [Deltaproteobacteria bacterium]|nr:hypothetical protein [Deltaproteobacteria bacterium]